MKKIVIACYRRCSGWAGPSGAIASFRIAALILLSMLTACVADVESVDIDRLRLCDSSGRPAKLGSEAATIAIPGSVGSPSIGTRFVAIDGQPFRPQWCNISELALEPGRHRLLVVDAGNYFWVEFDAETGHRYEISITFWNPACVVHDQSTDREIFRLVASNHVNWRVREEVFEIWGSREAYERQYDDLYFPLQEN
jgi:hypothetical protein